MAGNMARETAAEPSYDSLRRFFLYYFDRFLANAMPNSAASASVDLSKLEQTNHKQAAAGLKQAINDIVESSQHLPESDVRELDLELKRLGIVTLSEVRRRYSKSYRKVLKRGRILSETEYYLVRNVIIDHAAKEDSEMERLEMMIAVYEHN